MRRRTTPARASSPPSSLPEPEAEAKRQEASDGAPLKGGGTKAPPSSLYRRDVAALLFLGAAALWTRLYRIGSPASVVFDEQHFGRFCMHYVRRKFFFDVHPPLGKMLLAFALVVSVGAQVGGDSLGGAGAVVDDDLDVLHGGDGRAVASRVAGGDAAEQAVVRGQE